MEHQTHARIERGVSAKCAFVVANKARHTACARQHAGWVQVDAIKRRHRRKCGTLC